MPESTNSGDLVEQELGSKHHKGPACYSSKVPTRLEATAVYRDSVLAL